jgi:putative transposase
MSHTSILVHYVFATHQRRPLISDELQPKLWAYMGGIARANGMKALAIGGMRDHVHLLLSLPATLTIAKAVQLIKAGSSKWMNDQKRTKWFEWQEKYGAFSIGVSQKEAAIRYICNQGQHHAKKSFDTELKTILKRHGIVSVGE